MVSVGWGITINRLVGAAACCVCGLMSRGGRGGGGGVGVALLVVGGGGDWCCAGRGSWRPSELSGCCVCAPCDPCGPWVVAVTRCGMEAAAWASGWGCGP